MAMTQNEWEALRDSVTLKQAQWDQEALPKAQRYYNALLSGELPEDTFLPDIGITAGELRGAFSEGMNPLNVLKSPYAAETQNMLKELQLGRNAGTIAQKKQDWFDNAMLNYVGPVLGSVVGTAIGGPIVGGAAGGMMRGIASGDVGSSQSLKGIGIGALGGMAGAGLGRYLGGAMGGSTAANIAGNSLAGSATSAGGSAIMGGNSDDILRAGVQGGVSSGISAASAPITNVMTGAGVNPDVARYGTNAITSAGRAAVTGGDVGSAVQNSLINSAVNTATGGNQIANQLINTGIRQYTTPTSNRPSAPTRPQLTPDQIAKLQQLYSKKSALTTPTTPAPKTNNLMTQLQSRAATDPRAQNIYNRLITQR